MLKSIDASFWDGGGDAQGNPLLVPVDWSEYAGADWYYAFIKCSEGTVKDKLFDIQWAEAKGKIYRSAYHFFRPDVDVISSVSRFIEYHDGDPGELPPILDLEVSKGLSPDIVARRAIQWSEEYQKRSSTARAPIVYSSAGFLGWMGAYKYAELSKYKLWIAQYYYDNMPDADRLKRIKDVLTGAYAIKFPVAPAPFKAVPFFQWTARGNPLDVPGYYTGYGSKKAVDFNWYNGDLAALKAEFHLPELPGTEEPADEISELGDGIVRVRGRRYGSTFNLLLIDTHSPGLSCRATNTNRKLVRVSDIAIQNGAQIAVNFDDWITSGDETNLPSNLAVSDGVIYRPHREFAPFLNIRRDGLAEIKWDDFSNLWNVASGKRFILQNGAIPGYLYGSDPQYIQLHPRTAFGIHVGGRLMALKVNGREATEAGVTLVELARILQEFGGVIAFDADGGYSSNLWIEGALVDPFPADVPERPVVNHLLVFYEKESPMPSEHYFELRPSEAVARSIRRPHPNTHIEGTSFSKVLVNSFAKSGVTEGDVYQYAEDVFVDGQLYAKAGDVWRKVYEANGNTLAEEGWTAVKHKGVVQMIVEEIGAPAPPPPDPGEKPASIEMDLAPGTVVTVRDESGNVIWTHTA
jgi:GH25 family lysozyme M1 (1,4-beta-N-acetylmuramidase)